MPLSDKRKYTAEEFFKLVPETNESYELINGEVIMQAAPSGVHQHIVLRAAAIIDGYIRQKRGKCEVFQSPFDVILDEETVVQPDITVNCDPEKYDGKRIKGSPDMIIEVVSANRSDDLFKKLNLYKEHGVREYWIIDPKNEKTLVYHFEKSDFPSIYTFDKPIPVGIYGGEISITVAELM